jgi:hypothetical protein
MIGERVIAPRAAPAEMVGGTARHHPSTNSRAARRLAQQLVDLRKRVAGERHESAWARRDDW